MCWQHVFLRIIPIQYRESITIRITVVALMRHWRQLLCYEYHHGHGSIRNHQLQLSNCSLIHAHNRNNFHLMMKARVKPTTLESLAFGSNWGETGLIWESQRTAQPLWVCCPLLYPIQNLVEVNAFITFQAHSWHALLLRQTRYHHLGTITIVMTMVTIAHPIIVGTATKCSFNGTNDGKDGTCSTMSLIFGFSYTNTGIHTKVMIYRCMSANVDVSTQCRWTADTVASMTTTTKKKLMMMRRDDAAHLRHRHCCRDTLEQNIWWGRRKWWWRCSSFSVGQSGLWEWFTMNDCHVWSCHLPTAGRANGPVRREG